MRSGSPPATVQSTITVVTAHGQVLAPGGPNGWVAVGTGTDIAYPG